MNDLVEFYCEVCGQRGFYSYEQAIRDLFEHKKGNHGIQDNATGKEENK